MPPTDDDGPLEKLRKRLYAQKDVDGVVGQSLSQNVPNAPQHWKPEPVAVASVAKKNLSIASLFLIFALGFFLIAGITTGVVLFLGGRSVSADHLTVRVEGPTTVAGGDTVPLLITITNDNPLPLAGATLTLDFPEGTVEADDQSKPLTHHTETIGSLAPGETVRKTVRASFFGGENQRVSIPITVEYKTDNSNATFIKKSTYEFTISSSPVSLSVSTLSEISSGQTLILSVLVRSNADKPLENIGVQVAYPFGFRVTSAEPEPANGTLFSIGTLAPGEEKELRITGLLSGQDGESRVFRFTAGALKDADAREFGISYTTADATVSIAKPFLSVGLSLNREENQTTIVKSGQTVSAFLSWVNSLQTPITDAKISVAFSGDAFDPESIEVTGGFYRSSDKTIVFDRESSANLAKLQPGDTGNGSFLFGTKTGSALSKLRNPTMNVAVSVSGRRIGAGQVAESVSSTITRSIKVQSDLSLSSRIVRTIGDFTNTGPWPAEAEKETTYTVMLSATNSVNSVASGRVVMILPSYVRFTNQMKPSGEFSFSEATREVIWNMGDLAPGTVREGSFQIAFLPSASQKGTSPVLVMEQTIAGFDRFVQKELSATASSMNTQITSDPAYQIQYGGVLQ